MSYIDDNIINLKLDEEIILGNPFDKETPNTHQETVICYCRTEDEKYIKRVEVNLYTGEVQMKIINESDGENPSSRRQGVSIKMSNEFNNDEFNFNIAQHKGQTYLSVKKIKKIKKKIHKI